VGGPVPAGLGALGAGLEGVDIGEATRVVFADASDGERVDVDNACSLLRLKSCENRFFLRAGCDMAGCKGWTSSNVWRGIGDEALFYRIPLHTKHLLQEARFMAAGWALGVQRFQSMRQYASKEGVDKERDKHDDFRICTWGSTLAARAPSTCSTYSESPHPDDIAQMMYSFKVVLTSLPLTSSRPWQSTQLYTP
jgi:hypothetical protein